MSFSVNTNAESLAAIRLLNTTNTSLSKTQERINSGYKINSAKDNASTFAIAQGMRSDINSLGAILDTIALGEAVTNVALTAAESILEKLKTLQTEVVKAQDPTANRTMIQESVDSIVNEMQGISDAAQFNGVNLLNNTDGNLQVLSAINRTDPNTFTTASTTVQAEDLRTTTLGVDGLNISQGYSEVQFGAGFVGNIANGALINLQIDTTGDNVGDTIITFEFVDNPATVALTHSDHIAVQYTAGDPQGAIVGNLITALRENNFSASYNDLGQLDVTSGAGNVVGVSSTTLSSGTFGSTSDVEYNIIAAGNPTTAMNTVEAAMTTLKQSLSRLGASANSLETQHDFTQALKDTLTSGVGTLVDADLAEESAMLQALQTKQQLGLQALSIANQQPGSVLSLFK